MNEDVHNNGSETFIEQTFSESTPLTNEEGSSNNFDNCENITIEEVSPGIQSAYFINNEITEQVPNINVMNVNNDSAAKEVDDTKANQDNMTTLMELNEYIENDIFTKEANTTEDKNNAVAEETGYFGQDKEEDVLRNMEEIEEVGVCAEVNNVSGDFGSATQKENIISAEVDKIHMEAANIVAVEVDNATEETCKVSTTLNNDTNIGNNASIEVNNTTEETNNVATEVGKVTMNAIDIPAGEVNNDTDNTPADVDNAIEEEDKIPAEVDNTTKGTDNVNERVHNTIEETNNVEEVDTNIPGVVDVTVTAEMESNITANIEETVAADDQNNMDTENDDIFVPNLSSSVECQPDDSADPLTSEIVAEVVDCNDIQNPTWEEDPVQGDEEDPLQTGNTEEALHDEENDPSLTGNTEEALRDEENDPSQTGNTEEALRDEENDPLQTESDSITTVEVDPLNMVTHLDQFEHDEEEEEETEDPLQNEDCDEIANENSFEDDEHVANPEERMDDAVEQDSASSVDKVTASSSIEGSNLNMVNDETNLEIAEYQPLKISNRTVKKGRSRKSPKSKSKFNSKKNRLKIYPGLGYTCDYCNKTFSKRSRLIVHIKIHTGQKDYTCTVCAKSFYNRGNLLLHMKIHTGQKDFECEICKKKFIQKVHLVHHTKTHTGQRDYVCTVCNKSFIEKRRLHTHFKTHTGEKEYKCQVCGKEFIARADVRKHFNRMHNPKIGAVKEEKEDEDSGEEKKPKTFTCPVCESIFFIKSEMIMHIKEHYVDGTELKCSICGKIFQTVRNLLNHTKLHLDNRRYTCSVCNKSFHRKTHLKLHTRIHYDQKDYKCEFCNKMFRQNSHLMLHVKIHTGQKDFVCTFCNKAFIQKGHLLSHIKVHSTVREFKCPKCDKEFFQKATLMKHMKTHDESRKLLIQRKMSNKLSHDIVMRYKSMYTDSKEGILQPQFESVDVKDARSFMVEINNEEKKFVPGKKNEKDYGCNVCGKKFVYFNNFVSHTKVHTTDKRDFVCEVCQKGFICRSHLIAHSKQHAEKKFKCEICSKMFLLESNLTQHMRTHKNDFVCIVCKQIFKENTLLLKHMEKHMRDVNVFYIETL